MNISKLQAAACALALSLFATSASANVVSLSGPASVTPGSSFSVLLEGSFLNGLQGGAADVTWDDTILTLDSVSLVPGSDPFFSCPGGAPPGCPPAAPGFQRVAVGAFGPLYTGVTTNSFLASLNFTAIGTGVSALGLADAGLGWNDAGFAPIAPVFTGSAVAVVPVPAAVWLFGTGLLGLIGVARRRTAA